ncbi:hypothetical protein BX600DRAFT_544267 [Xylariales sp. PMI_506]|nr:hypothetical protein BX600DRAFT_544267 [Xylariales sp. PMI_506]
MASRLFARIPVKHIGAGGVVIAAAGIARKQLGPDGGDTVGITEADIQFATSYGYTVNGEQMIKAPPNWTGRLFEIRNDYPKLATLSENSLPGIPGPDFRLPGGSPADDAPWLKVDFRKEPDKYCSLIREYCYEGNVNNEFVLQKNSVRQWYHAPWMHWNENGREPLNGLTFERPTPPGDLASTQNRLLQTWACGFYNWAGATVFGDIWQNPNNPRWEKFKFPIGTCVFKILMTDAKDSEIPSMKGSPSMQAVISPQGSESGQTRNDFPSELRLLQMDFAVRDDRAPIGWVFGTFMYDGNVKDRNPWNRTIPVGIMWGNDPNLWPADVEKGAKPQETWINPAANQLLTSLGGKRIEHGWGWNGRANGPADNFISACSSCHSTSQKNSHVAMTFEQGDTDAQKMHWFRNVPAGEAFTPGDVSGDYSLQLMTGYSNYRAWRNSQQGLLYRAKLMVPFSKTRKEAAIIEAKRAPLRVGAKVDYSKKV